MNYLSIFLFVFVSWMSC